MGMIMTADRLHAIRCQGKRPPGWVYLSLMGEVRLRAVCIVLRDDINWRNDSFDCLAGLDVCVVSMFPLSHRALDAVDLAIRGGALNVDAIDPLCKARIGIVCSGQKFFTVQPFEW